MARCCASAGVNCGCSVQAGEGTTVEGDGTLANPYRVNVVDTALTGETNDQFATTISGPSGARTIGVDYAPTATLDGLPDVAVPTPATGDVLTWDGAQWVSSPVAPAAPGTVNSDTSINGDGAVATPLAVAHDPDRFTSTSPTGIGINDAGRNRMVLHYADAAARAAATLPVPELNSLTVLDTLPGVIWYWDGGAWIEQSGLVPDVAGAPLVQWSGVYVNGRPLRTITREVNMSGASFVVMGPTDFPNQDGLISANVQVIGATQPLIPVVSVNGASEVVVDLYDTDGNQFLTATRIIVTALGY